MTTRPVDITTSTSETATDISFVFNYPIINSEEIQVRTVQDTSSNTNIGLNGLQIKYNDNKNTNVVLFNNNSYSFNSFYISKGADITTGTEYDYSVIIKNKNSKPNKNDNLYILIPFDSNDNNLSDTPNDFSTLKSTINTYSTDISTNNNNYINIGNLNLNLNEIINTDDTFYTYTLDNDTFISLPSSIVSLNMSDPSFEQFYSEITDASVTANETDATINTSSNFPMNMNLNIYGSEENIYIDCSPVADGSQEQIIREKKVYSIKPLINIKTLGDNNTALLFTFILILVIAITSYALLKYKDLVNFITINDKMGLSQIFKVYVKQYNNGSKKNSGGILFSLFMFFLFILFITSVISIFNIIDGKDTMINQTVLLTIFVITLVLGLFTYFVQSGMVIEFMKSFTDSKQGKDATSNQNIDVNARQSRLQMIGIAITLFLVVLGIVIGVYAVTDKINMGENPVQWAMLIISMVAILVIYWFAYSTEQENIRQDKIKLGEIKNTLRENPRHNGWQQNKINKL